MIGKVQSVFISGQLKVIPLSVPLFRYSAIPRFTDSHFFAKIFNILQDAPSAEECYHRNGSPLRFKLQLPMEWRLTAATFGLALGAGQLSLVPRPERVLGSVQAVEGNTS